MNLVDQNLLLPYTTVMAKIIPASRKPKDTPVVTVYRHRGLEDQAGKFQLRAMLFENRMEVWDAFAATHDCYYKAFGVPEEDHVLLVVTDGTIDLSVNNLSVDLDEHPMAEKLFQGLKRVGLYSYTYDFDWFAARDRAHSETRA